MSLDLAPSRSTPTGSPTAASERAPAATPTPAVAAPASLRARARRRLALVWAAVSDPSPVGRTGPDPRHEAARRDALWARDDRLLR